MPALRNHAIQLARESVTEELRSLQSNVYFISFWYKQCKENILAKLKRTLPGGTHTVQAMRTEAGESFTDRRGIAQCLQNHWRNVFQRRPIDGE